MVLATALTIGGTAVEPTLVLVLVILAILVLVVWLARH